VSQVKHLHKCDHSTSSNADIIYYIYIYTMILNFWRDHDSKINPLQLRSFKSHRMIFYEII